MILKSKWFSSASFGSGDVFFPNQLSFNSPSYHYICARLQYKLVYIPTKPLNLIFLLTHGQYVLFSPYIKFLYFCSGVKKKIPENPKYLGGKKKKKQEQFRKD